MKNFLSFTLAAGVAITTAQVAQAAGVTKVSSERLMTVQAQMPGSPTSAASAGFDRSSLNRELARISELVAPIGFSNDGLTEDSSVSVTKKVGGSFTY